MTFTVDQYEEMMAGLVADGDLDLFVQIFYFTDRIGHMLWNYLDPAHPFYDAQKAPVYQQAMLEAYKRMDRIVGRARELVGPETLFLVCSDHGFSSYRRGVNYNNWLQEQGLLTLTGQTTERATLERLFESRDLMGGYDWKNTKAYAMGLGGIYINVIGREGQGSVLPGPEYEAVRQQIIDGLEALVDENGAKPVTKVWKREEIYSDYRGDLIPDLRVGNSLGYRVSWQTTLGGFGQSVIEDNDRAWTGDHCSNDPSVVPGILFSNRPIHTDSPRMIDMMPTIVKALGLEVPEGLDGEPLF
jgi:predicted AlkP superfamily phosphohydrolase/phosphomutase